MSLLRRAGLRRTATLRNHGQRDRVTHTIHDAVLRRDKECVAAKLGFVHVCRDGWGMPHAPYALPLLTMEHVKDEIGMGQRADSDMEHLVALCGFLKGARRRRRCGSRSGRTSRRSPRLLSGLP